MIQVKKQLQRWLTVVALLLLALGAIFAVKMGVQNRGLRVKQLGHIAEEAERTIDTIERGFSRIEALADSLATIIAGTADTAVVEGALADLLDQNPTLLTACGVAFEPYAFDSAVQSYAPYLMHRAGQRKLVFLEDIYDYQKRDKDSEWYHRTLAAGSLWQEPYYGKSYGGYIVEYARVIERDGAVVGVLFLNYPFEQISLSVERLVDALDIFGYGCMISAQQRVIYHPEAELVRTRKNLLTLAKESNSLVLERATSAVAAGESGVKRYESPVSNVDGWLVYHPIERAGWGFLVILERDSTEYSKNWHRKHLIFILFCVVVAATLLVFVHLRNSWVASLVSSFILLFGVIGIWSIVTSVGFSHRFSKEALNPFAAMSTATRAVDDYEDDFKSSTDIQQRQRYYDSLFTARYHSSPTFIPTGLFIQSIEYESANNVSVTGYVWQKYSPADSAIAKRGVVFPEAIDVDFKEAYRDTLEGNVELIGWYFNGVIRENFNHMKYPFDSDDFWIRLWHKEFTENIILMPDYESYGCHLARKSLPGIENDFVVGEWQPVSSYFSMREQSYNSSMGFGAESFYRKDAFPELFFNVKLNRIYSNAFISHLIPLFIVAALLFLILMIDTKEKSFALTASGLFFVLLFDHIGLREDLAANGIVYLEYFYFILYFTILFTSLTTYLYAIDSTLKVIQYKNKKIPKLLFFPVTFMALFVVTTIVYF